jgi:hypothetical protein
LLLLVVIIQQEGDLPAALVNMVIDSSILAALVKVFGVRQNTTPHAATAGGGGGGDGNNKEGG